MLPVRGLTESLNRLAPLLLLCVSLAACGGTERDVSDCDRRGINARQGREGRCIEEGVVHAVVNRGNVLRLRELEVRLLGVDTRMRVADRYAGSEVADGAFVILTLAVRNKLDVATPFDIAQNQVSLVIGRRTYREDFEAENGPVADSFLFTDDTAVRPNETDTGKIVFDVPSEAAERIQARTQAAELRFLNFTDAGRWDRAGEVGIIRLWR